MNKVILAGVAAVTLLGSGAVYAQHRHHHHHHHQRFSADDKAAFVDARIAAMKAGLRMTPDQEKNWPAVETAIRDYAKQRIARAEERAKERDARRAERQKAKAERQQAKKEGSEAKQASRPAPDLVNRLHRRADAMAERAAGLKKIADAADPLYKSLDDGQKRRLAALVRMGGRLGGGGAMRAMGRDFDHGHRRHHERGDRGLENGTERL
ncbi:Spy/CpxP family protein refolding chaperone [Afipia sp. TerB]